MTIQDQSIPAKSEMLVQGRLQVTQASLRSQGLEKSQELIGSGKSEELLSGSKEFKGVVRVNMLSGFGKSKVFSGKGNSQEFSGSCSLFSQPRSRGSGAVSYTHLDVYKRQLINLETRTSSQCH